MTNTHAITRGIHVRKRLGALTLLAPALALTMYVAGTVIVGAQAPLAIDSACITISGTSNIHPYTASTSTVRLTRAVEAFEIAIPAATLTSPREGLDKNMHEALKVKDHPDIVFRLLRFEPGSGAAGTLRGIGVLQIAGVEREVSLDVTTQREGSTLKVQGRVRLLMTDFGIKPPTAMLGMLKTDPKVAITFEAVLAVPRT